MPKMCEMPAPQSGAAPLYISPLTVAYIRPGSSNTCVICFADNHSIGVGVAADEARRRIDVALNEK
jgi:hypothetical protein